MAVGHVTDYYLDPGCIFFSKTPTNVRTVVGSCVVVCLWDKKLNFGGMSHFQYPSTPEHSEATARYGNASTLQLLRLMYGAGCKSASLVAQILGGARPAHAPRDRMGERNVAAAREVLARNKVTILSEDVGGTMGRKLAFNTGTGEVAVLKVHRLRSSDWSA